jgi:hypothetical protein
VKTEPATTPAKAQPVPGAASRPRSASSLATKPNRGGIPAIDAADTAATHQTTGMRRPHPASLLIRRVPV